MIEYYSLIAISVPIKGAPLSHQPGLLGNGERGVAKCSAMDPIGANFHDVLLSVAELCCMDTATNSEKE